MPLYEDLVRQSVDAGEPAASLRRDSRLVRELAQILRRAHNGEVSIRRCSWCNRFEVGGEWLQLDAIGEGQQCIAASLLSRVTHGICPECQEKELRRSRAGRAHLRRRSRAESLTR